LKDILAYFGVAGEDVHFQTYHVESENRHSEVRVSFSIRARTGFQAGQMVTIYEVGTFQGSVFYAQTSAVQKCVEALLYIGYNVPSYSSMRISTLEVGLFDNTPKFCARLATQNLDDVVSLITYMYRFVVMSIYAWF
jgi:hypothetical protein